MCSGYRLKAPPTPARTLRWSWEIGRAAGLQYVYLGNVLGHRLENTYCTSCGATLIERWGLRVTTNRLQRGCCSECDACVPDMWISRLQG